MLEKYNKLMYPKEFRIKLGMKLGIEPMTIRNYFETNRIPTKHKAFIEKALDLQLVLDEKIRQINVDSFEELQNV